MRYDSTMSEPHSRRAISSAAKALMLALSGIASAASTTGAPTGPVTAAAVAPTATVAPMTGPRIIEVLDQTIDWYQQPPPKSVDASGSSQTQTLAQLQDKFTAQGVAAQQELDSNQHQLAGARADRGPAGHLL
jgi:hypothetical protein